MLLWWEQCQLFKIMMKAFKWFILNHRNRSTNIVCIIFHFTINNTIPAYRLDIGLDHFHPFTNVWGDVGMDKDPG